MDHTIAAAETLRPDGQMKQKIVAYRYLERQWADRALSLGEFRLMLLSHYRTAEDEEIRDENDGLSRALLRNFRADLTDPRNVAIVENLRAARIELGGARGITIINNFEFRDIRKDPYVLCLSTDPNAKCWPSKDAVIEILDLDRFGQELVNACKLKIARAEAGEVKYDQVTVNLEQSPPQSSSLFRKAEKFKNEKELRIAFTPQNDPSSKDLVITCPAATSMLKLRAR
jgi:hypothetical protein